MMEPNPVWAVFGISVVCVLMIWSVFRYAERGVSIRQPWIDVVPKFAPHVVRPTGRYILHSGNISNTEFWVLEVSDSQKWQCTRAADSCAKAAREHELLLKKFMDLPAEHRAKRVPNATNLEGTGSAVLWAQKNGDVKLETVGTTTFAFVDPYETNHRNLVLRTISSILGDPAVLRPQLNSLYR